VARAGQIGDGYFLSRRTSDQKKEDGAKLATALFSRQHSLLPNERWDLGLGFVA